MVIMGPSSALSASGATCRPMSGKLPSALPTSTTCYCIAVPNGDWSQWVRGALLGLLNQLEWDDDPTTVTRDQAHEVFKEMYLSMTQCFAVPVGGIIEWASSADCPAGFLPCDGTSLNKNEYPELFGVIGYTWGGSGDNFNVPDKRGNVTAGVNASHALASEVGEETHTMTESELVPHTHSLKMNIQPIGGELPLPVHGYSAVATLQTNSTGGGNPFNVMQPTQYSNFIICAGR